MDEIRPLLELVPNFGLWVVFLWLYLRGDKERRETQVRMFEEVKAEIRGLAERLARHIDRTENPG
jgi:hypothetical protein